LDIWNGWSLQLTKGSFVEVGGGFKYKEEENIAMLYTYDHVIYVRLGLEPCSHHALWWVKATHGGHSENAGHNLATASSMAPYFGNAPTLGLNHIHNMFLIEDTQLHKVLTNYLKGKSTLLAPELFHFQKVLSKKSFKTLAKSIMSHSLTRLKRLSYVELELSITLLTSRVIGKKK
jgi:hypothetical protein